MKKEITEVLVIGAGPSGIVSASYLHNQGIQVKVLEKAIFPRFSIGESLLPQTMDNLKEAGLLEAAKKGGFQKKHGARFIRNGQTTQFNFSDKYGDGWDWTWQVPRADFDNLLANEVIKKGVAIEFGAMVTSISSLERDPIVQYKDKDGNRCEIQANFIIDASGNGQVLAKKLGLEAPPKITENSSIFTHIAEKNRPSGIEGSQITFEILDTQVWFWYIPFSNGNSSLGFVGPNNWFLKFSKDSHLAFHEMLKKLDFYKNRFENCEFLFPPVQIENIGKNITSFYGENYVLTGNSAGFLDPVFSSGVSFATYSGLKAAKLVTKKLRGDHVDWERDYVLPMQEGISVFASYVKDWYSGNLQTIMFHPSPNEDIKKKICSVLAGYVWDNSNIFVRNHGRILKNMAHLITLEEEEK